jgi:hypothetical protein
MKTLIGIAAGMLVFGAGYHLQVPASGDVNPAQTPSKVSNYDLYVAGNAIACRVTKGEKLSDQITEIKLSEGCGEAYARLAKAAFWHEGGDGDVALTTKDGQAVVRFASGDGVAYESYRPAVPFISLVAKR